MAIHNFFVRTNLYCETYILNILIWSSLYLYKIMDYVYVFIF